MATLYRTTGYQEDVYPGDGKAFTMEELQTLVGGNVELYRANDGRWMAADGDGMNKVKPINHVATTLYKDWRTELFVGEVLVGSWREFGGDVGLEPEFDYDHEYRPVEVGTVT